ncbi:unnamed protein product [Caenorhabditis angaria]|uniref:Mitochondrial-processing peptidase subunit beta n=1 Tax=Caenorhabditis angaria TaxID=860376 RepID=A0A9P1ISF9_9PELO|nr:unnamed protein product [Caenorhabditis angaria]
MYRRFASNIITRRGSLVAPSPVRKSIITPETVVTTLPSGFRVATQNVGGQTATIGVWIDAGSRYENDKNNGTAHFLEHMAFKGTPRRSKSSLELEVENIGSHLNAYTSREHTTYYAKCFNDKLDQSVDILSDILLNSNLDKRDIEAERGVILREMEEVEQNLQEVVFDELHTGIFPKNALGYTILGPVNNINSIAKSDLQEYVKTHYRSGRMTLVGTGGVRHDEVVRLAEKYFGGLQHGDSSSEFHPAKYETCELHKFVDQMPLCYGALVVEGVSWTHEDNLALMVANSLIGEFDRARGFGVNAPSRLANRLQNVPEIQSFQAFNTCYKETGIIGIYFVVEPTACRSLVEAVIEAWKYLATEVDAQTLEKGKKTLLTNLELMLDGSTPICEDIGRQLLCYGRKIDSDELEQRINAITIDRFREVAEKIFMRGKISTSIVGATKSMPKNREIQDLLRV